MCSWLAASLLDWAARCDVAGRPEAASEAFALAAEVGRPGASPLALARLAHRLRALAEDAEHRGAPALALGAREAAAEMDGPAVGGSAPPAEAPLGPLQPHAA